MSDVAVNSEAEELEIAEEVEDGIVVEYDIASYPSDLTLSGLLEMWNDGDIIIPDFQREFVWTIRQSSLLIDSFLSGLPVPQIFLYIDEENKNLVIDGQQRVLSVVFFLQGYFGFENLQGRRQVFRLTGLDDRSPYHRKRYEDLEESDKRKLRSAVLRAVNIRQLAPRRDNTSVYHIFERLNTGGTPLRPQEIRNCVFRGEFATILRELNKDKNWRIILGRPHYDKHQRDVELILRIFSLVGNWTKYEKPMKEFLNINMRKNQAARGPRVEDFKRLFPKATRLLARKLGGKPFHVRGPLNTSALDSVMAITIENFDRLPKDLDERYKKLLEDEEFHDATYYGTSDFVVLQKRFQIAEKYLLEQ